MALDMIRLENIKKIYSLGDEEVRALDGVTLHVKEHEFVAIVGASGSGKSTLMNMIGCLDSPDEGEYYIDGQDVSHLSERALSTMRNRKIGFIFQQFNLLPKLTAYENVELPLIYQGLPAKERRERVETSLERVGLKERMKHRPNQLSGGQQQRVAVARALATHPSLILADEPTGNLDSRSSRDIMQLIHELHEQGNTIILITHDEGIAAQAERQVRLMDGKIISDSRDARREAGSVPQDGRGRLRPEGTGPTPEEYATDGQGHRQRYEDAGPYGGDGQGRRQRYKDETIAAAEEPAEAKQGRRQRAEDEAPVGNGQERQQRSGNATDRMEAAGTQGRARAAQEDPRRPGRRRLARSGEVDA